MFRTAPEAARDSSEGRAEGDTRSEAVPRGFWWARREGRARFTRETCLYTRLRGLLGYVLGWQGALLYHIVIEVPVHFPIVAETGAGARKLMFGAKGLEPFSSRGPVYTRRPRRLLQMFQREQRRWSRLILSKFDVGELPSPIAAAVRLPILIQKSQNAEQLRLLQATCPRIRSVEGVYS